MSNAIEDFKGAAEVGITPDDNPGLEAFVEGAGEMPAPQPAMELVKPEKNTDNVLLQVQLYLKSKYAYRYNLVLHKTECRCLAKTKEQFHDMNDYEYNSQLCEIKLAGIPCSKDTLRTLLASSFVPAYDPYLSFIKELPQWDGEDHIRALADTIQTTRQDFWRFCFTKWFAAMAISWREPNVINHTAIVLQGKQGVGKTTWLSNLIPSALSRYAYTGKVSVTDKDTLVKLSECAIIIMDELENMARNFDALKEMMTKSDIYMRRAYGYTHEKYVRRASFAGSINYSDFLHDMSGNRRFLCFEAQDINYQSTVNLEQAYAQALYMVNEGFRYWFNLEEIAEIERNNEAFRAVCVEEEQLFAFYEPCKEQDEDARFMMTSDINKSLLHLSGLHRLSEQKLGRVLKRRGFLRVKRQERYGYILKLRNPEPLNSLESPVPRADVQEENGPTEKPIRRSVAYGVKALPKNA